MRAYRRGASRVVTEPELIRQRHIEILRHFPGSCMQTCAARRSLMLQANTLYGPPELGSQERKQLLLLLIRQCIYSGFDFGQCTHVPNVALQQSPANYGAATADCQPLSVPAKCC